jgi:magnesium transporter
MKRKRRHGKSMYMARYAHRAAPGLQPGSIRVPEGAQAPSIRLTGYGPEKIAVFDNCSLDKVRDERGHHPVLWVDVAGLGDAKLIEDFGRLFGIHRLALEDVAHTPQRSKVELYPDYIFVVAHIPCHVNGHHELRDGTESVEQVSFFIGKDYVLSWRERSGGCFDEVNNRLRVEGGVIRRSGSDYLLYALLDAVIDSYFPVLEEIGDRIDVLDDEMLGGGAADMIARVHSVRQDVRLLRRVVWPLREAVDSLGREHEWLIGKETTVYFRDCHDHIVQIIDSLENYREACSDLRDYHATEVSNRMNEIMKVLTIMATIFIPLSFIAGVYGMNFDPAVSSWNMPELGWHFGYPLAIGLMVVVAIGELLFFRWKGWLSSFTNQNQERSRSDRRQKK